ncbi:MAG: hypothetical protein OEY49_12530, partial [Candidatus Heimdallarchaeota archaeon]|nr:hypothetical protein [Candidatus Heimdallarchaeota archaeon]
MSRAIIIGTGMAGKLTAKVISPYVDEVIMIERNKLDVGKEVRKGIPQGNHFHALLSRGYQIINNLFPKTDELMKLHNGNKIDMGQDFTWYHCGIWKKKHHMDIETYVSSRPLLDWILLQQVKEIKNVKILDNTRVVNLIYNKIYNQVIGVKITKEGNLIPTELTANIVIDTSGRSTKTEKWFEDLGIGVPKSKEVKVDLKYASRYFEMPDELKNKLDYTLIYPKPPYSSNIGFIYPMEGKIGITLSSMFSEIDISTEEGFKDHIMNLDHPLLSE